MSAAISSQVPVPSKARGRQAAGQLKPNGRVPVGNHSESQCGPENHIMIALGGDGGAQAITANPMAHSPAVANTDPASSKARGRQALASSTPTNMTPAGNSAESQVPADTLGTTALGGDGGAQEAAGNQSRRSLAIAHSDPALSKAAERAPKVKRGRQASETSQPIDVMSGGNSPGGDDPGSDGGAHLTGDHHRLPSPAVAEIIQLWRMRQRWHRAEKALTLQGRALCRSWTEGDKTEANRLFDAAGRGGAVDPGLAMALAPFLAAIAGFGPERAGIEKRLRKLAHELPFWSWVAEIKGFGDLNLAGLVGEAGELASYRNPSRLWKRMGLAVISGERQRRKTDAAAAEAHGYNPRRRTVAYLLGDTLIKAGDGNRYRPVYAERRARTAETHPDWTKAHSHNDAARVMVKRVLRDLWIESRRLSDARVR